MGMDGESEVVQVCKTHKRIHSVTIMIRLMKLMMFGVLTTERPKIIMKKLGPIGHGGHGKMIVGKMETFQSGTANHQNDRSISERSTYGERRPA